LEPPPEPTADIEAVSRIVKRVGRELLADQEIGSDFIQPLKIQGVVNVEATALVVRGKLMAMPARPTYLQRHALHRLIDAFAAAEIHFAQPNVTLRLGRVAAA